MFRVQYSRFVVYGLWVMVKGAGLKPQRASPRKPPPSSRTPPPKRLPRRLGFGVSKTDCTECKATLQSTECKATRRKGVRRWGRDRSALLLVSLLPLLGRLAGLARPVGGLLHSVARLPLRVRRALIQGSGLRVEGYRVQDVWFVFGVSPASRLGRLIQSSGLRVSS